MIKIIIKDLQGNEKFAPEYESLEIAQSELTRHLAEKNWGNSEEITWEIIDCSAQIGQEIINSEALAYLAYTDWLIIREMDSGESCPAEIKQLRAEARSKIVR